MHEASIAISVLNAVTDKCREAGYNTISSIKLEIGRASGVLPEALAFAFAVAKAGTIACDAELLIDVIPIGGFCNECQKDFELNAMYVLECPLCRGASFNIIKGHEMDIIEMDVA